MKESDYKIITISVVLGGLLMVPIVAIIAMSYGFDFYISGFIGLGVYVLLYMAYEISVNRPFKHKYMTYHANKDMKRMIKEIEYYSNNNQMMDSCVRIDLINNYISQWKEEYAEYLTPKTLSEIEKYKDVLKDANIELKGIC